MYATLVQPCALCDPSCLLAAAGSYLAIVSQGSPRGARAVTASVERVRSAAARLRTGSYSIGLSPPWFLEDADHSNEPFWSFSEADGTNEDLPSLLSASVHVTSQRGPCAHSQTAAAEADGGSAIGDAEGHSHGASHATRPASAVSPSDRAITPPLGRRRQGKDGSPYGGCGASVSLHPVSSVSLVSLASPAAPQHLYTYCRDERRLEALLPTPAGRRRAASRIAARLVVKQEGATPLPPRLAQPMCTGDTAWRAEKGAILQSVSFAGHGHRSTPLRRSQRTATCDRTLRSDVQRGVTQLAATSRMSSAPSPSTRHTSAHSSDSGHRGAQTSDSPRGATGSSAATRGVSSQPLLLPRDVPERKAATLAAMAAAKAAHDERCAHHSHQSHQSHHLPAPSDRSGCCRSASTPSLVGHTSSAPTAGSMTTWSHGPMAVRSLTPSALAGRRDSVNAAAAGGGVGSALAGIGDGVNAADTGGVGIDAEPSVSDACSNAANAPDAPPLLVSIEESMQQSPHRRPAMSSASCMSADDPRNDHPVYATGATGHTSRRMVAMPLVKPAGGIVGVPFS